MFCNPQLWGSDFTPTFISEYSWTSCLISSFILLDKDIWGVKIRRLEIKIVAAPAEFKCQKNMEMCKPFLSWLFCPFRYSTPSFIFKFHSLNLTLLLGLVAIKADSPQDEVHEVSRESQKTAVHCNSNGPAGSSPPSNYTHLGILFNKKVRKGLLTQPTFANKSQDKFSFVWQGWLEDQRSLVLNLKSHAAALWEFDRFAASTSRYLLSSRCCYIVIEESEHLVQVFKETCPCPSSNDWFPSIKGRRTQRAWWEVLLLFWEGVQHFHIGLGRWVFYFPVVLSPVCGRRLQVMK